MSFYYFPSRVIEADNAHRALRMAEDESFSDPDEVSKEFAKTYGKLEFAAEDLLAACKKVAAAHSHIETANIPEWLDAVEEAIAKAGV